MNIVTKQISELKPYENNPKIHTEKQIDENGNIVKEYSSMKEAAKTFGITRQAISAVCHGKRKKIKGYYWKWI